MKLFNIKYQFQTLKLVGTYIQSTSLSSFHLTWMTILQRPAFLPVWEKIRGGGVLAEGPLDDGWEFAALKPNHYFQQQEPSLITAKNNKTLNILTPNLQESEVFHTLHV